VQIEISSYRFHKNHSIAVYLRHCTASTTGTIQLLQTASIAVLQHLRIREGCLMSCISD